MCWRFWPTGSGNAEAVLALFRRIGTGPCRQGLSEACETDEALRLEA